MPDVFVTSEARADLADIREHSIERFGWQIADDYFLGFDEAFDRLADYPHSAPAQPELGKGIRCLTHRQHRLFYRVENDTVVILRVIHHAMDARRAMNRPAG